MLISHTETCKKKKSHKFPTLGGKGAKKKCNFMHKYEVHVD